MFDDSSSEDERHFGARCLLVEPPSRHIDLNTIPQDGSEFIHKAKLEEELLVKPTNLDAKGKFKLFCKKKARDFSLIAMKLKMNKTALQKKFPKKMEDFYEKNSCKDWCLYLFGSELCAEMYFICKAEVEGHLPLLSVVLYYSQDEIQMLIKYIYQCFLTVGMKEEIAMWLYALLACLEKPVNEDFQDFFDQFLVECKAYLKSFPNDEKAYFISILLSQNFCTSI